MLAAILATLNSGSTPPPTPTVTVDAFDAMLISTCSILSRQAGTRDSYGQTPRTLEVLEANVPCLVSRQGSGDEQTGTKEFSVNRKEIAMRPWALDADGEPFSPRSEAEAVGALELNPSMSIRIGTVIYDIKYVKNWLNRYHHFTVVVEQVMS